MTDIQIPREAVKAAGEAFTEAMLTVPQPDPIEAALRAGLKAWPNGGLHVPVPAGAPRKSFTLPAMILPVLWENPDAEA